jgi:hypothetical protein
LLNAMDLALLVSEGGSEDIEKWRSILPAWTLILVVSGLVRRAEEKIAYEEGFLSQVMKNEFRKIKLEESLSGVAGIGRKLLSMLRSPWSGERVYWKQLWKGGSQSLIFMARPEMTPVYVGVVREVAVRRGYPVDEIGIYIQPIEHNRGCQVEFQFFYDPGRLAEVERVRGLYREAAGALMDKGAYFTRPYGELASMVYERAAGYTMVLRRLKKVFDPKNIMNPGNLCF